MSTGLCNQYAAIAGRIWAGAAAAGFRGSDPYDGLNSRLLAPLLGRSRLLRLAVIQGVKRSPLDVRPLLRVPPGLNPKGLALLLHGAAVWPDADDGDGRRAWLADALLSSASLPDGRPAFGDRTVIPGLAARAGADRELLPARLGWGYDFPWQSRAFLQPAFFPTVVATSFVVDALAVAGNDVAIEPAARFVETDLRRHEDADGLCFSYSPGDDTRVYNASLFGARILAQAAAHGGPDASARREAARRATDWVVSRQREDGSWVYGEAAHWGWIDNLHTGYNLETIDRLATLLGDDRWEEALRRGLDFYRRALFLEDGTPRYYTTSLYPLDPHSFAQGALTFLSLRRLQPDAVAFADRILGRGIEELWDERRGGFRFQKHRRHTQPAIHLRWSQAWMFRALCARLALHREGVSAP
ncbi:MAG: hypothetical protein Q7W56_12020 [Candidatus Latescibacteria bacterium]|nr:hypothetical protein [Candidatus Latescibacterota bacterium]